MNHTQVKRTLFTITSEYFSGATVDMANTKRAKKTKPLVTMRFGTAHTTTFPVEKVLDGELCSCYAPRPGGLPGAERLDAGGAGGPIRSSQGEAPWLPPATPDPQPIHRGMWLQH